MEEETMAVAAAVLVAAAATVAAVLAYYAGTGVEAVPSGFQHQPYSTEKACGVVAAPARET